MQQFCFVLNCQDLQSTRNCIIYNHLNVSWKILDVNLKMCDEAHTFSKFFLGNMQAKQCGDSWFSTGWGRGRPKLAALTLSTGGGSALQKEGQATDSRCLAYKYMFVKQISLVSHSHSVFYPQCDLEQFLLPSSRFLIFLRSLEKECKVSCGHIIPEATENILRSMAIKPSQGVFLTPDYLYVISWQNSSFLKYVFNP